MLKDIAGAGGVDLYDHQLCRIVWNVHRSPRYA
jgi:hypothetical protein